MSSRRKYLAALASLASASLAGCSGEGQPTEASADESTPGATDTPEPTSTPADTATPTETSSPTSTDTPTETATSTPEPAFGPRTFSGDGTTTTEEFQLTNAPLTAEYSHEGEMNFQTTLVALEGESYQDVYLTNAIGTVEGSKVANVTTSGPFTLDVNADGAWEITLEQVPNPQPQSLPVDASGEGPTYLGPYQFDGATTFEASHSGEQNFIVSSVALDTFGIGDIMFNEVGSFEGSTTARPGGLAYLNVEASGEWELSSG